MECLPEFSASFNESNNEVHRNSISLVVLTVADTALNNLKPFISLISNT